MATLLLLPPANEVWGKVLFLHLFVILFTGGGLPECMLGYPPPPPTRHTNPPGPGTPPPGTRHTTPFSPPGPGTPPPSPPPRTRHTPPPRDQGDAVNGWYASYWNAILFAKSFSDNCMKMKEIGSREVGASLMPPWYC